MPKKKNGNGSDEYYQAWKFKRVQTDVNTDEEWAIKVPRSIVVPKSGTFPAIVVHNIGWWIEPERKTGQWCETNVCLTYSPRATKTIFVTGPGDLENLFWDYQNIDLENVNGPCSWHQNPVTNRYCLTDDYGRGRLIVGDYIYLQINTGQADHVINVHFSIDYTNVEIGCKEYVEALAEQLATW